MKRFGEQTQQKIEAAVANLEQGCFLEVVVRIAPRSEAYRDVRWAAGSIAAVAVLTFVLFGPIVVRDLAVLPNVLFVGALAGWAAGRASIVRLLTARARRNASVVRASEACFIAQSVSGTVDRTGVLVYASVAEDELVVLPDLGARGAAPEGEWAAIVSSDAGALTDRIFAALTALGALGRAHLPASEDCDNPDELPNRPVVG